MEWLTATRLVAYVVGAGSRDLEASLPGDWIALVVIFAVFGLIAVVVLLLARRRHVRLTVRRASLQQAHAAAPGFGDGLLVGGPAFLAPDPAESPAESPAADPDADPAADPADTRADRPAPKRSASRRPGRRRAQ